MRGFPRIRVLAGDPAQRLMRASPTRVMLALGVSLAAACSSDSEEAPGQNSPGGSGGSAGSITAGTGGSAASVGSGGSATGGSSAGGTGGVGASGGAAGAAGVAGTGGSAGAIGETDSISNSNLSAVEMETNVAAAPNGTVVATWIGVEFSSLSHNGYAFSTDGGQTWLQPQKIVSPDNRTSSDPVVYADENSNFYLTWIGFQRDSQRQPYDMRVYAAKADTGTTQFGPVIDITGQVQSDSVDKPWITVAKDGTVYITWLDTGVPRMRIAVSGDGAQSFQSYDVDTGQGFRNLIFPCVDDVTGRVVLVYHPGGGVGLRYSTDKGQTWPSATAVALQTDPDTMFDDPTCAAHDGKVFVAYGIGTDNFSPQDNPRSDRIRIAVSNDGGQTIAAHYFAEDSSAGAKFLHPQLARAESGDLLLLYYAGIDSSSGDPNGTIRIARSTNEGQTWAPSEIVKRPINFLTSRGDQRWLGDYIGLYVRGAIAYGVYADNTSGFSHVHFFKQ